MHEEEEPSAFSHERDLHFPVAVILQPCACFYPTKNRSVSRSFTLLLIVYFSVSWKPKTVPRIRMFTHMTVPPATSHTGHITYPRYSGHPIAIAHCSTLAHPSSSRMTLHAALRLTLMAQTTLDISTSRKLHPWTDRCSALTQAQSTGIRSRGVHMGFSVPVILR